MAATVMMMTGLREEREEGGQRGGQCEQERLRQVVALQEARALARRAKEELAAARDEDVGQHDVDEIAEQINC